MFQSLLPASADNAYRGHKIAVWLFAIIVLMRSAMSLNSIFNGAYVANSADGIPLNTYPAPAAQTAVALFALLGLAQLMMYLLSIVVLVRYRSLVPLMFALLLVHFLSARIVLRFLPIVRTGTPPGPYVNWALFALMIAGLALSLRRDTHAIQFARQTAG